MEADVGAAGAEIELELRLPAIGAVDAPGQIMDVVGALIDRLVFGRERAEIREAHATPVLHLDEPRLDEKRGLVRRADRRLAFHLKKQGGWRRRSR